MRHRRVLDSKRPLFDFKLGTQNEVPGFYQLFFLEGGDLDRPVPLVITYSNEGVVDTSHFPKEEIIKITNAS